MTLSLIRRKFRLFPRLLAAFFLTALVFQNCDNVKLTIKPPPVVEEASVIDPNPFGKLEPVLAVRNTGCIMCHAKIDGDLVTDFGAGNPFFMGTDDIEHHPKQKDYYSPFQSKHFIWDSGMWKNSSVMGDIYVPDEQIRDQRLLSAYLDPKAGNTDTGGIVTVLDFVSKSFISPHNTSTPVSIIGRSSSNNIDEPGLRGQFKSRKTIWIDSPSANEIRDLMRAPEAESVLAKPGAVVYKGKHADVISGLEAVQSQKTYKLFITNQPVTKCKGDVVIDSVVFLKNLRLDTDKEGCRLYVTGTVFIQGPITYVNGGDSNLQITSARAIIMGFRSMKARFTQMATNANVGGIREEWTDEGELRFNEGIINDRDAIDGLTNDAGPYRLMVDSTGTPIAYLDDYDTDVWQPAPGRTTFPNPATCVNGIPKATQPCGTDWTGQYPIGKQLRRSIHYEHLLLNAPKIHSRYHGVFQGVIIGEDVLFAVDNFSFAKDQVLFRTRLLPLLENRIFSMSDN